ncbi:MAG: undecaprenyl/decaprenyl-phosphate alpha-N-acetylglucosaminyl 1-phosphate transferase [Micrococcales bacterium]|nr:undecaprenyl/decaprenyl-phosphate alpha-N-acetylglucosaminyl 1-phosphate transferase [Micrococcales bacterium]
MRYYLFVIVVAATVTYLLTPAVRLLAVRVGAITAVRARDVHTVPTPRLGGVAMYAGIVAAVLMVSHTTFLQERVFESKSPEMVGILGGAGLVCALGVLDDVYDLDWLTKLLGQILAAGFMTSQGVLLYQLPVAGTTVASTQTLAVVTVVVMVVGMNAVNFVDGLDGLAAGVLAIGGAAFFAYVYLLVKETNPTSYADIGALVIAALVGVCLGFLPHNLSPARIFMGDSGALMLGFVFSAAAIVVTGNLDPGAVNERMSFPAVVPILLPVAVLLLPLLDMTMAVVRRVGRGRSPFHADRRHLHHRLLQLGHTERRAVAIMYVWTAVFAFGVAALVLWSTTRVLIGLGVGVVVATLLTIGPLRGRAATETTTVTTAGPTTEPTTKTEIPR